MDPETTEATDATTASPNGEPSNGAGQADSSAVAGSTAESGASPETGTQRNADVDTDFLALPGDAKEALRDASPAQRAAFIKTYKSIVSDRDRKLGESSKKVRELERAAENGKHLDRLLQHPKSRAKVLEAVDTLQSAEQGAEEDEADPFTFTDGKQFSAWLERKAERIAERKLSEAKSKETEFQRGIREESDKVRAAVNGRITDAQWNKAIDRAIEKHGRDAFDPQSVARLLWPEVVEVLSSSPPVSPSPVPQARTGRPASVSGAPSHVTPKEVKPWEAENRPATTQEVLGYLRKSIGFKDGDIRRAFRGEDLSYDGS